MRGGATHPFLPTSVGQWLGLLVAAAGMAAVSVALLQMPDAEFDLAPLADRSGAGVDAQGAH